MNYMHPSREDNVLALAGRRKIPDGRIEAVRRSIRQLFEQVQPVALVASAAAGADLLALSEAGRLGVERYVVLPFAQGEFREKSVADLGEAWTELFDHLVEEVEPEHWTVLRHQGLSDDAAYAAANHLILDCATALAREGKAIAVRVWDGAPRGAGDLTQAFGTEAARRGMPVRDILMEA